MTGICKHQSNYYFRRMRKSLLLIACLPFLFSCVEDENPSSQSSDIFKVTSVNFIAENETYFAIIHDSTGLALDYGQLFNGKSVEFVVDKSKKHHVSTFMIREEQYGHKEYMSTFTNQDLTFDMVLEYSPSTTGSPIGTFEVIVTDDEPVGAYVTAQGNMSEYSVYTNTFNQSSNLFAEENRYLVVANGSGNRRYLYLDNPKKDNSYTIEYSKMKEFETVFEIPKSDYSQFGYNIISMENRNGQYYSKYILATGSQYNNKIGSYKLEYIDAISTYSTIIQGRKASNPKTTFVYSKFGSPVTNMILLDVDEIIITKDKISDFQFGTKVDGALYSAGFLSSKNISDGQPTSPFFSWSINGTDSEFSLTIPEGLKASYPFFLSDLSHLYLSNTAIRKTLKESNVLGVRENETTIVSQWHND